MESYRPVARLATVVKLLLALNVVGSLGAMASSAAQIDLLNRIESGEDVYADAVRGDRRQALVGVSGVVLYLVTAVAFVAWFKRAYDNVEAFGHSRDHGAGWAIGAWLVPILNLFRPIQIAREIWAKSTAEGLADSHRVPGLFNAWWAAWIISRLVERIISGYSASAAGVPELRLATYGGILNSALLLATACLAIAVVQAITSRQETAAGESVAPVTF